MALTLLYGQTEASILAAITSAQNDLMRGKMLVTANSGDVQTGYALMANAKSRIEMLQGQLYRYDPVTYSMYANSDHSVTVASFNTSSS